MVHARKPGAMGHCHGTVEGLVTVNNYAVIDDFIQSGRTLRFIRKAVSDSSVYMTCCTNVFLYNNPDSDEVGRNKVLRIFDNEPIVHMFYID